MTDRLSAKCVCVCVCTEALSAERRKQLPSVPRACKRSARLVLHSHVEVRNWPVSLEAGMRACMCVCVCACVKSREGGNSFVAGEHRRQIEEVLC